MRILFLCHRIPFPPDKGDKIRAFHELRGLAAAHDTDVFTLADEPADLEHRTELARFCRTVYVAPIDPRLARLKSFPYLLTGHPLTIPYFRSAELNREVRKAIGRRTYDRIFIYSSAMAQYVDWNEATPAITDLVDVDSDKWVQYAGFVRFPFSAIYRREGRLLRSYEGEICRRSSSVVVTTEREAQLVRGIQSDARVHVIPNGVDTDYFYPAAVPPSRPTVTFMGDMSYFPNVRAAGFFAESVFPLVRKAAPDSRFLIVGRRPTQAVRKLQKIAGVEVTGWVPDVRPYLALTHISVAPFSIAAGIPNKVLEAMACGLPVVATRRAVQGLASEVAAAVEIAENAEEIASTVIALLLAPELARRKGLEGRRRVIAGHNWESSSKLLLRLVEDPGQEELYGAEEQSSPA